MIVERHGVDPVVGQRRQEQVAELVAVPVPLAIA